MGTPMGFILILMVLFLLNKQHMIVEIHVLIKKEIKSVPVRYSVWKWMEIGTHIKKH